MKTVNMAAAWDEHYAELDLARDGRDKRGFVEPEPQFSAEELAELAADRQRTATVEAELKASVKPVDGMVPVIGTDGYPELVQESISELYPACTWEEYSAFAG